MRFVRTAPRATSILTFLTLASLLMLSDPVFAHGERAQQANVRMRTINWYDVEISPAKVEVGEIVTVKGRMRVSKYWPDHLPSVTERVFLNVGTSGPNFVRLASHIDGISMVQSTSLEIGRDYEFDMTLKARRPGRFHVHPVLSVLDAGGMVGPGIWVDVFGVEESFENSVETMFGKPVDLETFNLPVIFAWHGLWFGVGGAWLAYWLRQRPLLVPRMRGVKEIEEGGGDGDEIISDRDRKVAIGFVIVTLGLVVAGYQWAAWQYPTTTPLRTSKVDVPKKEPPQHVVDVALVDATYRIPGRSFQMQLTVTNNGSEAFYVGEFAVANVRFINPAVKSVEPFDSHDLIAQSGLRVENDGVEPGETKTVKVFAEDALWETQRLTEMLNDPDSVIAGLLFFESSSGAREVVEVGGSILPVFQ
ncbi:MAG: bacterial ammonia monooxygenase, subunit AmoB [Gammaproteobacteria bacterium]